MNLTLWCAHDDKDISKLLKWGKLFSNFGLQINVYTIINYAKL